MNNFLSCDWGTSAFRLRLVKTDGLKVVAEEKNNDGIAGTFKNWINENKEEKERLFFYQSYILEQIKKLEHRLGYSLRDLPILLSGMASSSIGMIELPYKQLPLKMNGSDVHSKVIEPSQNFSNKLFIISGACTEDDVLRGEETLLIGTEVKQENEESVYIFPGTHSKHVYVHNGMATHFKTYITGELFDLLSTKSILSNSVEKTNSGQSEAKDYFFKKGVMEGSSYNILNSVFHIRTNQLFNKNTPAENYHYLSGLLIGTELKELLFDTQYAIFLVCGENLKNQYGQALEFLGLNKRLEYIDADEALINGQLHIYKAKNPLH